MTAALGSSAGPGKLATGEGHRPETVVPKEYALLPFLRLMQTKWLAHV